MKKMFFWGCLFASSVYSAGLDTYIHDLGLVCPDVNPLIAKKSLIELNENDGICTGAFTAKLLASCPDLNCVKLSRIYQDFNSDSGKVIGRK